MLGADAFLFFTGAPDTWLTTERQQFAEAAFAASRGCSIKDAHQRWKKGASWCPRNPNAHEILAEAALDLDFMNGFGLSQGAWDKALAMGGIIGRAKKGAVSGSDRIRIVIGLSMLGFSDPMQFFCRQ